MKVYEMCKGKTREQLLELSHQMALGGYNTIGIDAWLEFMGKQVKVVKGRKVPIGTTGKVNWIKEVNYSGQWFTWEFILGIDTEDGRVFVNSNNVEVIGESL